MVLAAVYAAIALLLAPMVFLAAEWVGHDNLPRGPRRMSYSVLAALMWPVLILGVVQFAMILTARRVAHGHPLVAAPLILDESDNSSRLTVHV